MEANSSEENPEHAAQARRAKRIIIIAMAFMVLLPVLLFWVFHT
jgi:hypothetical protein